MPLIHKPSKKALEHNIKAEMEAHPGKEHRAQNLAIAYDVQRRAKKMAKGGPVSAKTEKRPMPEEIGADSAEIAHNDHKKPLEHSGVLDNVTVKQAQHKPKIERSMGPKMVPTTAFTAKLRDQEGNLIESIKPASPKEQPAKMYDEKAEKHTSAAPDMEKPHNKINKKAHLAKGGMINEAVSMHDAEEDMVEHPAHLEEDDDQMAPSEKEVMADDHMDLFAEGGMVDDEEALEHHASIVAAIMAKRKAAEELDSGSEDEDHAEMFAEGGMVDLDENAEESPNMADKYNFEALKKENYDEEDALSHLDQPMDSNEHGDEEEMHAENKHDSHLVSAIRAKMKKRSPIVR